MKEYFIRLFGYDRHANLQILETISASGFTDKPLQLMAHLLAAQQIWLKRCENQPAPGGPLWPTDWTPEQITLMVDDNYTAWVSFLQSINEDDLQNVISYRNFKGQDCNDKLVDILAHIINHGTHHRAQAGQVMKQSGLAQLPGTDYILYAREQA